MLPSVSSEPFITYLKTYTLSEGSSGMGVTSYEITQVT